MALVHLWSGAVGLADGSSWVNAFTTRAAAYAAALPGDTVLVASDHTEASPGTSLGAAGSTESQPVEVMVVDRATGDYAPWGAGNTLEAGGYMPLDGDVVLNGEVIRGLLYLRDRVSLVDARIHNHVHLQLEGDAHRLDGCRLDWKVNATYARILLNTSCWAINGGSSSLAVLPYSVSALFVAAGNYALSVGVIKSHDFSAMHPDHALCGFNSTSGRFSEYRFLRCVFAVGHAVLYALDPIKGDGDLIEMMACDFGAGYKENRRYTYRGNVTTVVDVVLDDEHVFNVAVDVPASQCLIASDKCMPVAALDGVWIKLYELVAGAKTITLDVIEDYTNPLLDSDAWLDVRLVQDADPSGGGTVSSRVLANGAALAGSAVTWLNAPLGSRAVELSIDVTLSAPCEIWVRPALGFYESGKSMWVNPKPRITAG